MSYFRKTHYLAGPQKRGIGACRVLLTAARGRVISLPSLNSESWVISKILTAPSFSAAGRGILIAPSASEEELQVPSC
jgi:hypothetical protein